VSILSEISPSPPSQGGNQEKVPLNKGDLGGSKTFKTGSNNQQLTIFLLPTLDLKTLKLLPVTCPLSLPKKLFQQTLINVKYEN
jgi:hypothetical protein